jgi:DNA-binding GntR family transcriptional regulator
MLVVTDSYFPGGRGVNRKTPLIDASAMPVPPLDLSRPAGEQIFQAVKAAILDTSLVPGRMISENEVGLLFGASRTPVREGFTRLREEGLILTRPSRGTYVSKISEQQVRGAQFLREALEVAVVERLCVEGLPDPVACRIGACLDLQAEALAQGDKRAFQIQDDRFHEMLAHATGYDRAATLLTREKAVLDRLRVLSLNDSDHMAKLLDDHRRIFDAIAAGYSGQAIDRMRRHLRQILDTLSSLIDANQDYFEA